MPFRRFHLITIVLLALLLIGTAGIVYSLSSETQSALKSSLQEKLIATAGLAAAHIDGDALARLQAGDETGADFIRIQDQLRHVKEVSPDIRYIYTMRKTGETVEFVVDADYGFSGDAAGIGERYAPAPAELLAGFSGPSADSNFVTDQWGTTISGYYPVRNTAGAVVGIVGVDMDSSQVHARIDRIDMILYILGIVVLILAGGGIIAVERWRSRDEQVLLASETKFKTLFESAGAAIVIMDQDRILECNHQTERIFHGTREEILSRSRAFFSPGHQPDRKPSIKTARDYMERALSGEPQFFEWVYTRCDGTSFTADVSLTRIHLQDRDVLQAIIQDISERKKAELALMTVTKKLSLLHAITFTEIQNAVFALSGYMALEREADDPARTKKYCGLAEDVVKKIGKSLAFARSFQDLGGSPARWQNVERTFILAVSHLEISGITRSVRLDHLEIYADPFLERVFVALVDNVLRHATGATAITLRYEQHQDCLLIFFEDDGCGIPIESKERIFEWGGGSRQGLGLFLAREILGITGITIQETGEPGKGARFVLEVPPGAFRFSGPGTTAGDSAKPET